MVVNEVVEAVAPSFRYKLAVPSLKNVAPSLLAFEANRVTVVAEPATLD